MSVHADAVIVGGGVVGLAIAAQTAKPGRTVLLFERNPKPGQEISSRSNEIIHAGLYYPLGSLKARFCVEGNRLIYEICRRFGIAYRRARKFVVAVDDSQVPAIEALRKKGEANGVEGLRIVSGREVAQEEPLVQAVAALDCPATGVVDSHGLIKHFEAKAKSQGAEIICQTTVERIEKRGSAYALGICHGDHDQDEVLTKVLINAAGLASDQIAALAGMDVDALGLRLQWWKSEHFVMRGWNNRIKRLIYPAPQVNTVGIHTTTDLAGNMHLGPSAQYLPERKVDYSVDPESRERFWQAGQSYIPTLKPDELEPGMAGIRPTFHTPGEASKDFVIRHEAERGYPGLINAIGIDSPGLTAFPAIGKYVGAMVDEILAG